jgi:HNH endonuclease
MKLKPLPPQSRIVTALDYNPDTGVFVWRWRPDMTLNWNSKWSGRVAGTRGPRGIVIFLDWKPYHAHRLAWVYVNGDGLDTKTLIDHKNCNCFDNSYKNLRPATHGQNGSNSRGWRKKKLPKGVSTQSRGKPGFRSRIGVDGAVIHLGTFRTPEEAHAAYVAAAQKAKGQFARAG